MPKKNPYDPEYIMSRDQCSLEHAMVYISNLKQRTSRKGKKIPNKKNPYDPTYIMIRDNCTFDEAVEYIKQYKANKATSLTNFIKRYGTEIGTLKYTEWKEKSLAKGHIAAKRNGKAQSKFSPTFYIRHGYSFEEAHSMAVSYQHENSPLHVLYYIKRGKTIEQAQESIRKIHDKKIGRDSYFEYLQRTTNMSDTEIIEQIKRIRGHCSRAVLGDEEFSARIKKTRSTCEAKGLWVPLADLPDYELYRKKVWEHTNLNDLSSLDNWHCRALAGVDGGYHLDHKFSISQGYVNNVPPEIIGSLKKLEFIPWKQNVQKQGSCSISLEELLNENQKNN